VLPCLRTSYIYLCTFVSASAAVSADMSDASASATVPAVLDIVSASATVYYVLSMLLCATLPWSDKSSDWSALVSGALSSVGQRSCESRNLCITCRDILSLLAWINPRKDTIYIYIYIYSIYILIYFLVCICRRQILDQNKMCKYNVND
jgi:hypothetical protein